MEQESTLNADANIDSARTNLPRNQQSGKTMVTAALGGLDVRQDNDYDEDAPLLGDESIHSTQRAGNNTGDDQGSESDSTLIPEYDQWAGLSWYKRPSAYWFLVPFLFSALAFGGIMVPKISLIQSLICREYYATKRMADPTFTFIPISSLKEGLDRQCQTAGVQVEVAKFTLQGNLISGILSAIIAPQLGALSDRYGRKKMMMITNAGALSGEIITIFAASFPETFPVYWILLGYFFDGICGSFIASMAISHSYATDCTPPAQRSVIFGYFHGVMFIGIALGPFIAGQIIKATGGVIVMFYVALGCHLAFILLLIFFIPESLSKARQRVARDKYRREQDANPAQDWIQYIRSLNIFGPLRILYPKGVGSSLVVRRNLFLLASVDTICFAVGAGAMTTVILYSQFQFSMTPTTQSNFIGIVSTCRVVCLLVILPLITRLVRGATDGPNSRPSPKTGSDLFELSIIRTAIFFDVIGFLGYTLATSQSTFIAAGAVASVGGVGSPTLQAALTKHVPPGQIGQLLGAMALLHAFARIIAPTFFGIIYALTVGKFSQAVFVILTGIFGLAWLVSWGIRPGVKLEAVEEEYRRRESSVGRLRPDEPLMAA